MGQQQTSISITSLGTISLKRSYICGNYNSTHYYARNNVTGNYELISNDATRTISYALSKLTSGRTWQETVLLKGTFLIGTTITLSQANTLLDCRQATLTSTANTILLDVHPANPTILNDAILGGHWIGLTAGGSNNEAIRLTNAAYCTVDGINAEDFIGNLMGAIWCAYGSSHITIQNCSVHDNSDNYCINLVNLGYNRISDCHLYNSRAGIFVQNGCPYNQILGCEFYGQGGHSIYLDGGSASVANNTVSGCSFHDQFAGAGLQIKCQNNSIYNNTFYNFTVAAAPAFSIYSEYSPSYANDNDIFNNTFTNVVSAMWLGHDPANYPTLRNKIHDNFFTKVTSCIRLNPWPGAIHTVTDTWIYYNKLSRCTGIFPRSESSASLIINTVIAYNDFGGTVTDLSIESYVNTMVYGNIGMANFNVPSPLPIPPR